MSRFNPSAKRVDTIARTYFAAHREAKENLAAAEKLYKANRRPSGVWNATPAEVARVAKIEADYEAARAKMAEVEGQQMEQAFADIAEERARLEKQLADAFRVDPAAIDHDTMTLINSGICTSEEYRYLMARADADMNATMIRLIGAAAEKARVAMGDSSKLDSRARAESAALGDIYRKSQIGGGSAYLEDFDNVVALFRHGAKVPAVADMWDDQTANFVEHF